MRTTLFGGIMIMAGLFACALTCSSAWATPPDVVNVHGALVNSLGQPLSGERAWIIRLFDAAAEGTQVGVDQYGMALVSEEGLFNIPVTLPEGAYVVANLWYELAIDSDDPADDDASDDVFADRFEVFSVPFARQAASVTHVSVANIGSGNVSDSEFNALDGVGGNIQAQLDSKPASSAVYTKSQANTLLDAKAVAANVYTKTEVDASQSAQDALIANKAEAADVNAANSSQDAEIASKASTDDVNAANSLQDGQIAAKANATDVYTKPEVDTALSGKANAEDLTTKANADDVYTKSAANTLLSAKANATDVANSLAGVNSTLNLKANTADLAISEAAQDAFIAAKADAETVYTKDEIDTQMAGKVDTATFDSSQSAQNTTIASKADSSTVNTLSSSVTTIAGQYVSIQASLLGKASTTSVNAKADKTYVDSTNATQDTAIAAKANTTDVNAALALKADATDVAASFAGVDSDLANKANTASLALSQAAQDALIDGKLSHTTSASIIVQVTSDPATNGANLMSSYTAAKALTPNGQALSTTNRAAVIIPPGNYDLGTEMFGLNASYVDLIGLTTARENQHIYGVTLGSYFAVIYLSADDVHIENLVVECKNSSSDLVLDGSDTTAFYPLDNLSATVVRNCEFKAVDGKSLSTALGVTYSGRYEHCTAGPYSFGKYISGATFVDCHAGPYSFTYPNAGTPSIVNSTFTNCTAGDYSFSWKGMILNTTFTDCEAGIYSFGSSGAGGQINTVLFERCKAGNNSFGYDTAVNSTKFFYCSGGTLSFVPASGTGNKIRYSLVDGEDYP